MTLDKLRQRLIENGFNPILLIPPEFAERGSLYDYLQNPDNPMDFQHILTWAREIAQGQLPRQILVSSSRDWNWFLKHVHVCLISYNFFNEKLASTTIWLFHKGYSFTCEYALSGMNYLHNEAPMKIIHRDLKSKNGEAGFPSSLCIVIFNLVLQSLVCLSINGHILANNCS